MIIRAEQQRDQAQVKQLLRESYPTDSEATLVEDLRLGGDVVYSLVAIENEEVIGHVMLSAMAAPVDTLALGPVTASMRVRGQGIAAKLIRAGLEKAHDWNGVFVLGDPTFYKRFGFDVEAAQAYDCIYGGPYFMYLPLKETGPVKGKPRAQYPEAFAALR